MQMFISKDPIEFESGDFYHYRYVENDPTHSSDIKVPNSEIYDHENFSPNDKEYAKHYNTNEWLGTPWGEIKKFNPLIVKITSEGKVKVK